MQCPACSHALPFYFAFSTAKARKHCAACRSALPVVISG